MEQLLVVALATGGLWLAARQLRASMRSGPTCEGCGLERPTDTRSTAEQQVLAATGACPQCGRDPLRSYLTRLEEPWSY
jgi:hypothetical protein